MPLTWIPRYLRAEWRPARATGSPRAASGAHAGCSGPRPLPLGVFSTPAAEGSVRCAASPAGLLAVGVDSGTAGAPALPACLGCPLPLDPVPPSLLSTWVAAAHPAGGPWGSRDPGYGLRRLPLPVCDPLCPITFNRPHPTPHTPSPGSAGAWCLAPKSRAGLERGGATGVEPGPGGQRQRLG